MATIASLGAMGVVAASVSAMFKAATLGQLIVGGIVGGALGGAVGGGISGGIQGAVMGALFGALGGAFTAGLGRGIDNIVNNGVATTAIMLGIGAGTSYATGGWQGLVTFGVGILGAVVGSQIGHSLLPNTGGPAAGDPTVDDILLSKDYGPFDKKFSSVQDLQNSLNEGDVVFGKRPVSFAGGRVGGTAVTDRFNVDPAHEHVFWKENGVLKDIGFTSANDLPIGPGKVFSESSLILNGYQFGPTLHQGNLGNIQSVMIQYKDVGYHIFGPNCQDFADAIRDGLY